jgi:hypothetical protein
VKPASAPPELPAERLAIDTVDSWVEVAPSPCGFPAAAEHLPRPAAHWSFPASVWERLAPAAIWIRGIDAAGRESPPFAAVRRPAAEEA